MSRRKSQIVFRLKLPLAVCLFFPLITILAEDKSSDAADTSLRTGATAWQAAATTEFDAAAADRFARLALACVHKEYPNKISHVLNSEKDVAPPHLLTPAFCGCYDWHSSVHGHWLLVRLLRTFPEAAVCPRGAAGAQRKFECG